MNRFIDALMAAAALWSCGGTDTPPAVDPGPVDPTPTTPVTPAVQTPAFAKGADISWVTEMESAGIKFYKKDGTQADILTVLKDCGMNAIRLRVWVKPYQGWSGKEDVVALAGRVQSAGMSLMVDFHYSDFFADPSRQQVPEDWKADVSDLTKMCEHVSAHTTEVLQALKTAGVTVAWVQIGNETRNGMLSPSGDAVWANGQINLTNFVKLYNAGYDAAKAVYPSANVMPHLDNAYLSASYGNPMWLDDFKAKGAKFDMIAFSHYPQNTSKMWIGSSEVSLSPAQVNSYALAYIKTAASAYGVPVIVSEVGVQPSLSGSADLLKSFMSELKKTNGCAGIFYWEPEVYGGWAPAVYKDADAIYRYTGKRETWGSYNQAAFSSNGRPSAILDAFSD